MFKVKSKIWLEKNDKIVFGEGRMILLKTIQETGSINKASKKMGITYKKAWKYLEAIEERLDIKLINKKKGGLDGGGSFLTKEANILIEKYEVFIKGFNEIVDKRFKKIFKNFTFNQKNQN